jgi:hypothetical protein
MGLPRKHHKLQIRMPECVGFGLLAALASLCLLSFGQLTRLNWVKADARVIGVNVPTDTGTLYSSISSTANGLSVLYEFEAGSRIVKGSWSSNCLSTPIVKTLAPDLVNTIEEMKSVHIGVLTEFAAHELLANTQATEAGSSAELAKSLRGEDFYSISGVRRKSLSGIMPAQVDSNINALIASRITTPDTSVAGLLGLDQQVVQAPPKSVSALTRTTPPTAPSTIPDSTFRYPSSWQISS